MLPGYYDKVCYKVSYKDYDGKHVEYHRDTVERGYYLYKSLINDGIHPDEKNQLRLDEVTEHTVSFLRGFEEKKTDVTKKPEVTEKEKKDEEPITDWFYHLTGMSREEYDECLSRFASLHGVTLKD